jgi:hypothetical protein
MNNFVFWTWMLCGAPLALDLISRAVQWLRDAARSGMVARTPAAGERPASDSSLLWTHV